MESPALSNSDDTLLGHPKGLFVLFFAEMWERFCYYGMRALLAFHIAQQFYGSLDDAAQAKASASYGGFTAVVYALGIFGGSVADRLLGYRRSIILGGLFMAAGEFMLMIPQENAFYFGLATLIVGNGLFKPNISTLVGKLYKPGDPRRDGGFTIFYMGINVGAAIAPVVCQAISAWMGTPGHPDYRFGFMAAGAGMLLGLICFGSFTGLLHGQGLPPKGKEGPGWIIKVVIGCLLVAPVIYLLLSANALLLELILYVSLGGMLLFLLAIAFREEVVVRQQMTVMVLLIALNAVFWMGFEQAGNSLNFFAKKQLVPFSVGGWAMPAEWWQSVNAVLIVIFGPIFSWLWVFLDKRGMNPSIPAKFGLGFFGMGMGFVVINSGIAGANSAGLVAWYFLLGLYIVHTLGELCLSPVGLSMVTKLAPSRMTGMVMGTWFISIATGNFLAGKISTMAANRAALASEALGKVHAYADVFRYMVYIGGGVGITVFILSRYLRRWMHGVK